MKKLALIFAVAIMVPSLLLAWLAVRSLKDQQFLLERQQSLLYQGAADVAARKAADQLQICTEEFSAALEKLLREEDKQALRSTFDDSIRKTWPVAHVGFVVSLDGLILSPGANGRAEAREFLGSYSRFLGNREALEVYATQKLLGPSQYPENQKDLAQNRANSSFKNTQRSVMPQQQAANFLGSDQPQPQAFVPGPQQQQMELNNASRLVPSETEFRQLIGEQAHGTLARYVDNKLNVLVWQRSPSQPDLVYGAMLSLPALIERLQTVCQGLDEVLAKEICIALLDDSARPVARSHPKFSTEWRRPFVATEIGEAFPHWEIGVYLLDPLRIERTAGTVKLILGLLVFLLTASIGLGGWLFVADLNRQLSLARKKTDFVSNVSHELKTPLTSIRMFSELLAEDRVGDAGRRKEYLGIINAEAARLTRLINNVLDFAKIERGEKNYRFQACDLAEIGRETAETLRPHLERSGFRLEFAFPPHPLLVRGDRDAISQIIVNLLSNAEKYSGDSKEILLRAERGPGAGRPAQLSVRDRGPGVPRGTEERIFEQFYRAHDSLSSGVPGTGLGLTLARQIARAHGGDVVYLPRPGGGSDFTLRLPSIENGDENHSADNENHNPDR